MDRNALCFCGSERKQKFCHQDIERESILASYIQLIQKIDKKLKESINPAGCHIGCSDCCKHGFTVTAIECIYVCYGYEKLYGSLDTLFIKNKHIYEAVEREHEDFLKLLDNTSSLLASNFTSKEYMNYVLDGLSELTVPCPFLDEKSNTCMVYEYRPLVCRYHGLGYLGKMSDDTEILDICEKNQPGIAFKDLVCLKELQDDVVNLAAYPYKRTIMVDMFFPLFYFLNLYFTGQDDYRKNLYNMQHFSKIEYTKQMVKRNRID